MFYFTKVDPGGNYVLYRLAISSFTTEVRTVLRVVRDTDPLS